VTRVCYVGATVLGLHLLAMNVLYPRSLGSRPPTKPTGGDYLSLIWGFIWGHGTDFWLSNHAAVQDHLRPRDIAAPRWDWMGDDFLDPSVARTLLSNADSNTWKDLFPE